MNRRKLAFSSYDDVIAEIERLQRDGYQKLGQWSLGQICRHLSYYFRGSLERFDFRLPWVVRKLVGPPLLRRLLRKHEMRAGSRTIPASVPPGDTDEQTAAAEAKDLLARLKDFAGQLHPSPLFDQLTVDQWRTLHLMHAAHHLGFLIPKESGQH